MLKIRDPSPGPQGPAWPCLGFWGRARKAHAERTQTSPDVPRGKLEGKALPDFFLLFFLGGAPSPARCSADEAGAPKSRMEHFALLASGLYRLQHTMGLSNRTGSGSQRTSLLRLAVANTNRCQSAGKRPRSSFTSTCLGLNRIWGVNLLSLSVLAANTEYGTGPCVQCILLLVSLYGHKLHMKVACIFDHPSWIVRRWTWWIRLVYACRAVCQKL